MSSYAGLTTDHCAEAHSIVRPTIHHAMRNGIVKRSHGNLVVLDPKIPREPKYKGWSTDPEDPFEELVLFEQSYGNSAEWTSPFKEVSRSKAYASWKTGLPTRLIQQVAPWLYEENWTKWPGSAVGPGGLVVAFSGVEDYNDEMFSEMMLAAIKGVCLREVLGPNGTMADPDLTFLGR